MNWINNFRFACLLILIFSDSAFSQSQILYNQPNSIVGDKFIDSSYNNCENSWSSNFEWLNCINEHRGLWEDLMQKYYDSLILNLNDTGQRLLKIAQKNWLDQQNSQSDFWEYFEDMSPGDYFGREGHIIGYEAELAAVRNRALELKAYLAVLKYIKEEQKEIKK